MDVVGKAWVLLALLILGGCSVRSGQIGEVWPRETSAIIFVPAFKGTSLDDRDGHSVWISLSEALFGEDSLALDGCELGLGESLELNPGRVFRKIPIIPWIANYDVYGGFLAKLRSTAPPNVRIVELPYDWRKDNLIAVKALAGKVEALRKEGIKTIDIVSHSMGGLITAYYLRYGTQDFSSAVETWEGARQVRRVVFAGAPFRGSVLIFHDMQFGTNEAFNPYLLSPEAYSTFPSSYQLLPEDGSLLTTDTEMDGPKSNLYDVSYWESNSLGLLCDTRCITEEDLAQRKSFTETMLRRGKLFKKLLLANPTSSAKLPDSVSILGIVGTKSTTPYRAKFSSELHPPFDFECEDCATEEGDGVVTVNSASLPSAFVGARTTIQQSENVSHSGLLSDSDNQRVLIEFLLKP